MSRDRPDAQGIESGVPIDTRESAGEQDAFWRQSFTDRAYTDARKGYDYYRPAYRIGWEWARDRKGEFSSVEPRIRERWNVEETGLEWEEARPAVRDAYERTSNTDLSEPGNPLA